MKEADVGEWCQRDDGGDFAHIIWAEDVAKLAISMGNTNGTLIDHVLDGTPRLLRKHLADEFDSWEEFEEAVRAVPPEQLKEEWQRRDDDKARDQAIATLQQQLTQLTLAPPRAT